MDDPQLGWLKWHFLLTGERVAHSDGDNGGNLSLESNPTCIKVEISIPTPLCEPFPPGRKDYESEEFEQNFFPLPKY